MHHGRTGLHSMPQIKKNKKTLPGRVLRTSKLPLRTGSADPHSRTAGLDCEHGHLQYVLQEKKEPHLFQSYRAESYTPQNDPPPPPCATLLTPMIVGTSSLTKCFLGPT